MYWSAGVKNKWSGLGNCPLIASSLAFSPPAGRATKHSYPSNLPIPANETPAAPDVVSRTFAPGCIFPDSSNSLNNAR